MRALSRSPLPLGLIAVALCALACQAEREVLDDSLCDVEGQLDGDRVCRDGFWRHLVDDVSTDTLTDGDAAVADGVTDPCAGCATHQHCCPDAAGVPTCVPDDEQHCGACGNACGEGQACAAGACVCALGRTDCDGDASTCEVALFTDAANCGQCGLACDGAEICAGASCICASTECGAGKTCCGDDLCVDTTSHAQHCGACGNACATGEVCRDGSCQCGNGAGCGAGERCCTDECRPVGTPCSCGGVDCTDSQLCCDSTCVNGGSRQNCGACGVSCRDDQSCEGGTCTCSGNQTECDGSCVVLDTSAQHCGACDNACGSGETCCGGSCRGADDPCSWWDTDWTVRYPLVIEPLEDLPAGAALPLAIDHAAMVAAGQSLADGEDLRVVRYANGIWTPITTTRDPQYAPGGDDTILWFGSAEPLDAGTQDTSYYLYAQNPSPTGGLAPYDALFELAADFDDGTMPASVDSMIVAGSINVTGGRLEVDTIHAGPDGALLWLDRPLPTGGQWHARFVARWEELEIDSRFVWLGVEGSTSQPEFIDGSGAPVDSRVLLRAFGTTESVNASHYRNVGSVYWRSAQGWELIGNSGSREGYPVGKDLWYVAEIYSSSTEFVVALSDLATGQVVFETDPVTWSSVRHEGRPEWLIWGERQLQNDGGRAAWDSLLLRRWYGDDPTIVLGAAQSPP